MVSLNLNKTTISICTRADDRGLTISVGTYVRPSVFLKVCSQDKTIRIIATF